MSRRLDLQVPEKLTKDQLLKLPTRLREQYIKHVVRETILRNEDGVTLQDLSQRLPFEKQTIAKYLSILKYTNEVYVRAIGNSVLYLPNTRLMHPSFERSFPLTDKELRASLLKNRLGEFVFIQEHKKDPYAETTGGGILVPRSVFKDFVRFLRDASNAMETMK
ncbi:MAG TPA: hypothetical protein VF944_05510 [Candidatus Bathyarchaeia archaeon]